MLTKTVGQLDTVVSPDVSDYIEIEHSGASGKVSIAQAASAYSSATESVAGTSNSYLMTPLQVRNAFNAANSAPVYACRAWVTFDGTTTSSAISGTYTRVVGTTTTVCVATAHGFITGNVAYVDFTSGGASDNSYLITVTDANTFTVQTVSTSSVLTSAFTLPRCPIAGSGNVENVSRSAAGYYHINFSTQLPNANYAWTYSGTATATIALAVVQSTMLSPSEYMLYVNTANLAGSSTDFSRSSFAFFD